MSIHSLISEQAERLLERGDLIGAAKLTDEHCTRETTDAALLVATSRVMRMRGRLTDAMALAERALAQDPNNGPALVECARQSAAAGDAIGANDAYGRAYGTMSPGDLWVLEWIEMQAAQPDGADMLDVATRFCDVQPGNAAGWFHLGLLNQRAARHDAALAAYVQAERLDPCVPMLQNNIAAAYIERGDLTQAKTILDALLAREPDNALAWNNLAVVLLGERDLAGSEVASERACALAPDYPVALLTRVQVLKERQQPDAALTVALRAQQLDPTNPSIAWAIAMLQLARGDYANGWVNHEARWLGSPELCDVSPNLSSPRWNGESLAGRTLFVWGEQGNGDAIQFVRFLPRLAERVHAEGGKLVYCCFAQLLPLFERSVGDQVDMIVPHDTPILPAHDFHLPLGSLPFVLGVTGDRLADVPHYLRADPEAVAQLRAQMRARRPMRVGLVWSGNHAHRRNPLRSIDPTIYARAFRGVSDVEFVSLQVDASADVAAMRRAGFSLADPTADLRSYDDTATLLSTLDLVITVCTSVAHLAGAVGVPVWLLLDVNPHWVWATHRTDSPWYPAMTLYRQSAYQQWEPVVERVSDDLKRLVAGAASDAVRADV
ncbi:tetratricopeptide repeat protein [Burkholderia cepacia]|uniref:tetratricopeptide repeat protein n=1 Tax=Burkholderia cepacia TaxID=292 RepID=UPI003EE16545